MNYFFLSQRSYSQALHPTPCPDRTERNGIHQQHPNARGLQNHATTTGHPHQRTLNGRRIQYSQVLLQVFQKGIRHADQRIHRETEERGPLD